MNNNNNFFGFLSLREISLNIIRIVFAWWVISVSSINDLSKLMTISFTVLILLTPVLAPLSSKTALNRSLSLACFFVAMGYAGYGATAYLELGINSYLLLVSIMLTASGMALLLPLSSAMLTSLKNINASNAVRASRSISSGFSIVAPVIAGFLLKISIELGMVLAFIMMLVACIFSLNLKIKEPTLHKKNGLNLGNIYSDWGKQLKTSFIIKWKISTERDYLTIACMVQFILAGFLSIIIPSEIKDFYHATGVELGLSESLVAGGMFISATMLLPKLSRWFSKYYISSLGLIVGSAGLFVCSISEVIYVFYSGLFLFGLGFSIYGMNGVAHRLKAFPENLRVSLSAFDLTASRLAMLLGFATTPMLIDLFNSSIVMLAYCILSVILSLLLLKVTGWKELMESKSEELDGYYEKLMPSIK